MKNITFLIILIVSITNAQTDIRIYDIVNDVKTERIKKDIKTNEDLGLNFINDFRTVTYKRRAPSELPKTFNFNL